MPIVYLNGEYTPIEDAKISVLDRGFLFGDGLYEIIPVYNQIPFYYERHIKRLQYGLSTLKFNNSFETAILKNIITNIFQFNSAEIINGIYIQVTRGAVKERNHIIPTEYQPTVFVSPMRFPQYTLTDKIKGIKAITLEDIRWRHCDIKAITLLPNLLARTESFEKNTDEAILIRDDYAIEGSISNLFAVFKDCIITAPANHEILHGITRELIIDLIKANGLPFIERKLTSTELMNADEVWISSATKEIMPITTIDGKIIGSGQAGKIWHIMHKAFQQLKQ